MKQGTVKVYRQYRYWKSLDNQRQYLESLYQKLQLKSINDWKKVGFRVIAKNEGAGLLGYYTSVQEMLKKLYPETNWDFLSEKKKKTKYWHSIDNQRNFMDYLFHKFDFKSLEEWKSISPRKVIKNGGNGLISNYQNYKLLLTVIYPNYPWSFESIKLTRTYFMTPSNQEKILEDVFYENNFKTLEKWHHFTKFLARFEKEDFYIMGKSDRNRKLAIINESGFQMELEKLMEKYTEEEKQWVQIVWEGVLGRLIDYFPNFTTLLVTTYPNYPWHFGEDEKPIPNWQSNIEYQRKFLMQLMDRLGLHTIDDFRKISKRELSKAGGNWVAHQYLTYPLLLSSIFPDHRWDEGGAIKRSRKENLYWKSVENQYQFMEHLFRTLNFNRLDEFVSFNSNLFKLMGGGWLYHFYEGYHSFLRTIYPNFPWVFSNKISDDFWDKIENQRKFLDLLFNRLSISNTETSCFNPQKKLFLLSIKSIRKFGGTKLCEIYKDDLFLLFSSVYPERDWSHIRFRSVTPTVPTLHSKHKLLYLQRLYLISRKEDWARVCCNEVNLRGTSKMLRQHFPDVKFPPLNGRQNRQRHLYCHISRALPQHLILENYRNWAEEPLELDLFIPSLNVGIEYQGQQHYNEVASMGSTELITFRDEIKAHFCKLYNIKLFTIPFWWDGTSSVLINIFPFPPLTVYPSDFVR